MLLFLKPAEVREHLNISKTIPLFYVSGQDVEEHFEELVQEEILERQLSEYTPTDKEDTPLVAVSAKGMDNFPYPDFAVVLSGVGFDKGNGERPYNFLCQYIMRPDGQVTYKSKLIEMISLREITPESHDAEADRFQQWTMTCVGLICAMFVKKNVISIVTGPTLSSRKGGKVKKVKSEYAILSSKRYLGEVAKEQGGKVGRVFSPHKVCGHWRHYWVDKTKKLLGLKQDVSGHGRKGESIKGRTWVESYTRGNEDINECIRIWKRY